MNQWKNFELDWLKPGMWITLRDRNIGLIVHNEGHGNVVMFFGAGWVPLSGAYCSNGLHSDEDRDIVAVHNPENLSIPSNDSSLKWRRKLDRVYVNGTRYEVSPRKLNAVLELLE